ncbi:MAG: isoleucine--tRNA ligase [Spirochaetia bacterium]|nr:isoleucine--tRNA ligase [Spirochaetia bacterium]
MGENKNKSGEKEKGNKEQSKWSTTICLPKTEFPMRAQLPEKEPRILEYWQKNSVFAKILKSRKAAGAPSFILHDGPPYANGNFHTGHALNKILKDIINKFNLVNGRYVPYVPGWDCHGLPIELAVIKKLVNRKKDEEKDPRKVREACRKYAAEFIEIQAKDQSRFGVSWDSSHMTSLEDKTKPAPGNFYYTMSADYEAGILESFRDLFKAGYIYKGEKPVYWDTVARTAMAEAEVEYEEHTSPSVYVAFPVKNNVGNFSKREIHPEFVVIWTTTPWTLPANLALCFHPEFSYAVYTTERGNLVIAEGLEESFFSTTGLTFSAKEKINKDDVEKIRAAHPFIDRESKIVFGSHVTLEAGTGVVHTAPGHGVDDYRVGLEYNLPPYSPVDHRGRYTSEFPLMENTYVFDANEKIIELLKDKSLLLHHVPIIHSYPHSWRSHSPLIFRATPQWFFKVEGLRELALEKTKDVEWIPGWGQKRFESMVENRPDWCLSRQRSWGVPIPAFMCKKCGETHMTQESLDFIIQQVQENGIEVWFDREARELMPALAACSKCGGKDFEKENDILDVWFDSGVSWYTVLKKNHDLKFPADLYLEGSDQHRGWFQSSLWPALALEKTAPYKKVLTHGYVLDDKGRAMSKSLGNVISPVTDIIPKYGADILRLWVSSEDYRTDNRISFDMLDRLSDSYRKIRNTFRYMLGNLSDGKSADTLNHSQIKEEIDLWALHELASLGEKIKNAYENYEFHLVYQRILAFCTVTLSNTYFDIIRDRLYCDSRPDQNNDDEFSAKRLSSLSALKIIFENLLVWLSPVLSFTAEEIQQLYNPEKSVFELIWPDISNWKNENLEKKYEAAWLLKDRVNTALEEARAAGIIKASLESTVYLPENEINNTGLTLDELSFILVVSDVQELTDKKSLKIEVKKSSRQKCGRCWIYRDLNEAQLCPRCAKILK